MKFAPALGELRERGLSGERLRRIALKRELPSPTQAESGPHFSRKPQPSRTEAAELVAFFAETRDELQIGGVVDFPRRDSLTIDGVCLAGAVHDFIDRHAVETPGGGTRPHRRFLISVQKVDEFPDSKG